MIPIILIGGSLFVWGSVALHKHNAYYLRNHLVATIVILLFLAHPTLVKIMFSVFSCRTIDGDTLFLVDNLEIECWSEEHTFYAIVVALPGIITWGIGIPTFMMYELYRNRTRLNEI